MIEKRRPGADKPTASPEDTANPVTHGPESFKGAVHVGQMTLEGVVSATPAGHDKQPGQKEGSDERPTDENQAVATNTRQSDRRKLDLVVEISGKFDKVDNLPARSQKPAKHKPKS